MLYYLTSAALVLLAFFWGAGLAWLVLPRRWTFCWPLLALPLGLALQSAVVWVGGWLPLAGTDAYGPAASAIPLGLLLAAWWKKPAGLQAWRSGGVLALALLVALLAASPWAKRGGAPTAIASGSCDAADYAAGARMLQEFRPDDRSGFVGQNEVSGILQVDNFHAHWRQLNHFTPAALLALDATLLGRRPHELVSLLGTLLVATLVPVTVLVARAVVRLPRRAALAVAALVGLGPVQNYAVAQVALGQMLAAAAVGVLAWGIFGLLRAGTMRRAWAWAGVIGVAWWLLLGSYAFLLGVGLAPPAGAGAWGLGRRGRGARLGRTLAVLAGAIAAASVFGWERLTGFGLRWNLHNTVEYGWPIPRLGPDGWVGLVSSAELHPVAAAWGLPVAIALVLAAAWGWLAAGRRDGLRAWTAAGLVLPAVAGYAILSAKGSVPGSNASYDAYKLLACFQPVLLAGLLAWWRFLPRGWLQVVPLGFVLAAWLAGAPLRNRAATRPLVVGPDLAALQLLETNPAVHSVNVLPAEMWPRLWANAFLLRKEQYFALPTYEGRRPTPLRGEWNLQDSLVRVAPPDPAEWIVLNRTFFLQRAGTPLLRADFAGGWHALETAGSARWRWSDGAGRIALANATGGVVRADLKLRLGAFRAEKLTLLLGEKTIATWDIGPTPQEFVLTGVPIPAGGSTLTLACPAGSPGSQDGRQLGVELFGFELHPRRH